MLHSFKSRKKVGFLVGLHKYFIGGVKMTCLIHLKVGKWDFFSEIVMFWLNVLGKMDKEERK